MTNRRKFLLSAVTVPVAATAASAANIEPPSEPEPFTDAWWWKHNWELHDRYTKVVEEVCQLRVQLVACRNAGNYSTSELAEKGWLLEAGWYGWSPAYQDVLDLRQKYEELKGKAMSAPSLRNRIVEHAVVNYATTQPTGYEDGLPVRGPLPTPKEVADYAKTLFEELKSLDVPFETQTEA